jgi:hypothetical protein
LVEQQAQTTAQQAIPLGSHLQAQSLVKVAILGAQVGMVRAAQAQAVHPLVTRCSAAARAARVLTARSQVGAAAAQGHSLSVGMLQAERRERVQSKAEAQAGRVSEQQTPQAIQERLAAEEDPEVTDQTRIERAVTERTVK